jgi:uncharacterized protein YjbI with pentapeptide repeats
MKKLFIFLTITFSLYSCSLPKLISENTDATNLLKSQNDLIITQHDTLINKIQKFNTDYVASESKAPSPDLANLKKTSYENFYFGQIVKEELLEKIGDWVKIKVQEKIEPKNGAAVIKERVSWYLYTTPDVVYQINYEQNSREFEIDTPGGQTTVLRTLDLGELKSTTKTDMIDQKSLDILLSQKALNFDGLKFEAKRFDYANFSLGSFRGTYFSNSTLSNVIAKREMITNDNDFFETRIEGGTNKDMSFTSWKFFETFFYNTTLENVKFENCLFSSDPLANVTVPTFNNVVFKKVNFTNTTEGYFKIAGQYKASYDQCRFTDVKVYGTVNMETKFVGCSFFNGLWNGIGFSNSLSTGNKITGGLFSKLKIIGGDFSKIIIEDYGGFKPQFKGVEIISSNFSKAVINATFSEGCTIKSNASGNFSQINFKESTFENCTFGEQTLPTPLINMTNCDFSKCIFQGSVKFIYCDLRGSIFPADLSNVTFIGSPR